MASHVFFQNPRVLGIIRFRHFDGKKESVNELGAIPPRGSWLDRLWRKRRGDLWENPWRDTAFLRKESDR